MNVEVRSTKNATEQALSAAFTAARATLPGKGAVAALREDAFKRFDAKGLPHRRVEEWKYTDLRALMREAKPLAGPAGAKPKGGIAPILTGVEADCVAIVNGRYEPAWSNIGASDPSITIVELFKFLAENPDYRMGQVPGSNDPAYWLNTAFMGGGVALRVKRGAASAKPIHIAHVFSGDVSALRRDRGAGRAGDADRELLRSGGDRLSGQFGARIDDRRRCPRRSHQDRLRRRRGLARLHARRHSRGEG